MPKDNHHFVSNPSLYSGQYSLLVDNENTQFLILNEGTEDEMKCYGYRISFVKTFLYYLCCVLTCGLLLLVGYWRPDWKHILTKSRCSFNEADCVFLQDSYKFWQPARLERLFDSTKKDKCSNDQNELTESDSCSHVGNDTADTLSVCSFKLNAKFFEFRCLRYFWDTENQTFVRNRGLDRNFTCHQLYKQFVHGIKYQEACRRLLIYDKNLIDVKVKSYFRLLVEEALNPFYVFQALSCLLWFFDDYYYYAACIVFISLVSIITTLIQTRTNSVRLRDMVATSTSVRVMRSYSDTEREISSEQLVPGDVIIIPSEGMQMECDAVLLNGSCVVNESTLTGESSPVLKTALVNEGVDADSVYDPSIQKQHTLFAGTHVMQARYYGSAHVTALVIRTGFYTQKGTLVRSILYPKPMDLKLYRDAMGFLCCLAVLAVAGLTYSIVILISHGVGTKKVIIRAFDVITIAVPPALPAAMSAGIVYATYRLKESEIFCINPSRINLSGKINLVCFDKTGTLTEDCLEFWGIKPAKEGRFLQVWSDLNLRWLDEIAIAMATCHSLTLLRNEICGDPIDLKMFETTEWVLEECGYDHKNYDIIVQETVTPPKCASESSQHQCEYGILKRFTFSSELKRMSVLIRKLGAKNLELAMKGAPETVIQYCKRETVPDEFSQVLLAYTQQGYRVLGLAHKQLDSKITWHGAQKLSRQYLENDLNFLGLLVMQNKVKPETTDVIRELDQANIRTVMITGDNLETAVNVARECEMLRTNDDIVLLTAKRPIDITLTPKLTWKLMPAIENGHQCQVSVNDYRQSNCRVACTGESFSVLRDFMPDLLQQLMVRGTVYARTSPKQKAEIIEGLQQLGYYVGMCGDGANDCGALKAAHAGISLSEAEASVASPFTSKVPNISCVSVLVREGRAALTTSFSVFKYMALYSIIQFTSVLILYWYVTNLGDFQYLFIDLFIILGIALVMGRTAAYQVIAKRRPSGSLTSFETLSSLFSLVFVTVISQTGVYFYLEAQPWYIENSITANNNSSVSPSYEGTTLFCFTCYQYILIAIVLSKGPPFQKRIYTNWPYMFILITLLITVTVITIYPGYAAIPLKLKTIPDYIFKVCIVLLGFGYFCVCYLLEEFLITTARWRSWWSCISITRKKLKKYEIIEREILQNDFLSQTGDDTSMADSC